MRRRSIVSSNRRICSAASVARLALIGALAVAVVACGTKQAPPPPVAPPVRPAPSVAPDPASYVSRAASGSLFIVKASKIVAEREGDTGLGSFASYFEADHIGIGAQLSFAGRRLNLLPSATLSSAHQAMFDELAASGYDAKTYLRQINRVLAQQLALHRQYERSGSSPTLRQVAVMASPIIAREIDQIRQFERY